MLKGTCDGVNRCFGTACRCMTHSSNWCTPHTTQNSVWHAAINEETLYTRQFHRNNESKQCGHQVMLRYTLSSSNYMCSLCTHSHTGPGHEQMCVNHEMTIKVGTSWEKCHTLSIFSGSSWPISKHYTSFEI